MTHALDIPPPAAQPQPARHPHALPSAVRDRQLARQAVTLAHERLEQAEHDEAMARVAKERAKHALAYWQQRLADAAAALAKQESGE